MSDPEELTDDVSLLDSGIVDSTGMMEIIMFLEGEYAIQIEDHETIPKTSRRLRRSLRSSHASSRRRLADPSPEAGRMIIDHVGIAVRSIRTPSRFWETVFGYRQVTKIITNTRQKVRVVFLTKPTSMQVKLIEPTDPTSPIHELARRGGGLHHLCFRCESLDAEVARLQAAGFGSSSRRSQGRHSRMKGSPSCTLAVA